MPKYLVAGLIRCFPVCLTEVWPKIHQLGGFEAVAKPVLVVDAQLGRSHSNNNKRYLVKRLKIHNNQAKLDSIGLKTVSTVEVLFFVTVVCKGSGGAALKH